MCERAARNDRKYVVIVHPINNWKKTNESRRVKNILATTYQCWQNVYGQWKINATNQEDFVNEIEYFEKKYFDLKFLLLEFNERFRFHLKEFIAVRLSIQPIMSQRYSYSVSSILFSWSNWRHINFWKIIQYLWFYFI